MILSHELPFGRLPSAWLTSLVIEQQPNTRWYSERGSVSAFRQWLDELHQVNRDLIPMQWAVLYVGASRAGIRKRALAGKLTVFSFFLIEPVRTLLGRTVNRESRNSFDYVLKRECAAWRDELFEFREGEREHFLEQGGRHVAGE